MNTLKNLIKFRSNTLILSIVWGIAVLFLAAASYVYAVWNPPTADPTGDNADPPINTSSNGQVKFGALGIGNELNLFDDGNAHIHSVNNNLWINANGGALQLNSQSASDVILADGGGNVGIGTTSPDTELEVVGDIWVGKSGDSRPGISDTTTFNNAGGIFLGDGGSILDNDNTALNVVSRTNLKFFVNESSGSATEAVHIATGGDLRFNNNELVAAYVNDSNIDHIWHNDASNQWNFVSDASSRATGNSAIGVGQINFAGGETILDGTDLHLRSNSGFIDIRPDDGTHGIINRNFTGGSTVWSGWRTNSSGDAQFTGSGNYSQFVLESNGDVATNGRIIISKMQELIRFNTDRAWRFSTSGTGSSTSLILQSLAGCKNFFVMANTGWTAARIYACDGSGGVYAPGFFYISDKSLKTNIKPIDNALDRILKIDGVQYDWKESGNPGIGLIANDVETVFPELVSTDEEGIKSLSYGHLAGPIIEAIKELHEENKDLRDKQEELEERIEELENK